MTSIYLAGKIGKNDWRHSLCIGLTGAWHEDPSSTEFEPWPILTRAVLDTYDYTGPYFISCDHGCAHGRSTHGVGFNGSDIEFAYPAPARTEVRDRCLNAIKQSDIVFAWIDDPTAHGTLVELGYAYALGKRVVVAAPWPWLPGQCASGGHDTPDFGRCGEDTACPDNGIDELWFAFECATEVIEARTPARALASLAAREPELDPKLESPIEKAFWNAYLAERPVELQGLRTQHAALGGRYRIDFALPDLRVAIELDGYAHHSDRESFTRDRQRQRDLEAAGWRVVRFSGVEVNSDAKACVRHAAEMADRFMQGVLA